MERKAVRKNTVCLNCGNTFKGEFCPHCGQKASTKRLKITETAADFVNSFVGGDNKFMRTCIDLFTRPGYMVHDYLLGKRVRYYNPLQLFLFLLTVFAIFSFVLGVNSDILNSLSDTDWDNLYEKGGEYVSIQFAIDYVRKIFSNELYGTFCISLTAVFPYRLLFFKQTLLRPDGTRHPLNLTEHFYTLMYSACIDKIVGTAVLPLYLIPEAEPVARMIYEFISMPYTVIMYKQLLGIGWFKSVLINLVAISLTYLLTILLFIILIAAAMIMEKAMK